MSQINTTAQTMILSPIGTTTNQMNALANPQTIDDVLGAASSEDLLSVMRQDVKDRLTIQRNDVNSRLLKLEKQISLIREVYFKFGPAGIDNVDTAAAQEIATLLTKHKFRKAHVVVTLASTNEEKREYEYKVAIHEDDRTYSSEIAAKEVFVPFTAEAKKLQKQLLDLNKQKQVVETELLQVKKDFGNIDEHIAAARAEIGRRRIEKLTGGSDLLASLTKKKPVVEQTVS